jgi:hypothetical protein
MPCQHAFYRFHIANVAVKDPRALGHGARCFAAIQQIEFDAALNGKPLASRTNSAGTADKKDSHVFSLGVGLDLTGLSKPVRSLQLEPPIVAQRHAFSWLAFFCFLPISELASAL